MKKLKIAIVGSESISNKQLIYDLIFDSPFHCGDNIISEVIIRRMLGVEYYAEMWASVNFVDEIVCIQDVDKIVERADGAIVIIDSNKSDIELLDISLKMRQRKKPLYRVEFQKVNIVTSGKGKK